MLCAGGTVILLLGAGTLNYRPNTEFRVDPSCDLHQGACAAVSGQGQRLELAITPLEIPLLQPLQISVTLGGIAADSVSVVFTGVGVDMGTLRTSLVTKDGRHFHGTNSLSVCSRREMRWQALVEVEAAGEHYAVPFLFDTAYRSQFELI